MATAILRFGRREDHPLFEPPQMNAGEVGVEQNTEIEH